MDDSYVGKLCGLGKKKVECTSLTLHKQPLVFTCLQYKSFESTVGKGGIARNEQFLLFPHSVLYPFGELSAICHFHHNGNSGLETLSF